MLMFHKYKLRDKMLHCNLKNIINLKMYLLMFFFGMICVYSKQKYTCIRILNSTWDILGILFRQITMFIKVHVVFAFGLQTLYSIDFTKIYGLMGQLKATQTFMNALI